MNPLAAAIAIVSVLALSALALAALALFQPRALLRQRARFLQPPPAALDPELDRMRASIESLASQIRELVGMPAPADPTCRTGLNLSRRSQVLRLHRKGEPPAQIAASLGLPHQEVELLIKVQKIVLSKL